MFVVTDTSHMTHRFSADEALARLIEGNERFVRGEARFPTVQKEILADLAKGQHPYTTILGCSDSRVPPELVFDAGFGELFIVRVAGNVISAEVMGTLPVRGCPSAHAALCRARTRRVRRRAGRVGRESGWLERAGSDCRAPAKHRTGLRHLDATLPAPTQMHAAVEANVRWSMRQLHDTPEVKARVREGIFKLVGAIYELETGHVRFLQ